MTKRLHIVCLDVPYPPDYGGASEMLYKIKSLRAEGIRIVLHAFDYGRGRQDALLEWCEEVHYYERMTGHKGITPGLPYIVSSRANPQLLKNLSRDEDPILFEGIHTTYFLYKDQLPNRKKLVRLHNVESIYYRNLSGQTHSFVKKIYAYRESRRLKEYEKVLVPKCRVLAIKETEMVYYRDQYGGVDAVTLPAFIGWNRPLCNTGIGNFCLYHGNLSVPENERAISWLLHEVFYRLEVPLVIAGKNPSPSIEKMAHRKKHICLVANPRESEMQDLIRKAQIHVLPSMSTTGIKFKLLNSVFCGRHCLVNEEMTEGTHLAPACHLATNANAFQSVIMQLFRRPFEEEEIEIRNGLLHNFYDNCKHARQLIQWIW